MENTRHYGERDTKKLILITGILLSTSLWADENTFNLDEFLNSSPPDSPSKIYVLDVNKEVAVVVLCINDTVVVMSKSGGLMQLMGRTGSPVRPVTCKQYNK